MKQLWIVFLLVFLHAIPLWNLKENLAGGYGDPFTHATIGDWYCKNVITGDFHTDIYLSPYGVDVSGTYDSPFPFILTCPFVAAGPLFQFHLFTLLQILLIVFSSWLVATQFLKSKSLQFCYILFVWWCGFYIARSHQHETLLSVIWGLQFIFYVVFYFNPRSLKSTLISSLMMALCFAGTFYNIASLLFFAGILVAYKLWQSRKDFVFGKTYRNLFLGLGLFSILFGFLWWPMIAFTLKNGVVEVTSQRSLYNLDLLSPFIPFETSLLYRWWGEGFKQGFERYNSFEPIMLLLVMAFVATRRFWQERMRVLILLLAVFYFVLSLGPELRINNEVSSYLDFNSIILNYFPFKLSRTPARFAAITNLCFILLGFIFLDQVIDERNKKYISYGLFIWILFSGPLLNQMWFFPTIPYQSIIPARGLASLKGLPAEVIVVSLPSAWAQDPTQNFNRLFHEKNITSAYLAYTAYNKRVIDQFTGDPFLGKMGCQNEITAFSRTPFLTNFEELHNYLKEKKFLGFVINKQILLNRPDCKDLATWTIEFLKLPWVHATEENAYFITAEIK